jgi:hypothetical protein
MSQARLRKALILLDFGRYSLLDADGPQTWPATGCHAGAGIGQGSGPHAWRPATGELLWHCCRPLSGPEAGSTGPAQAVSWALRRAGSFLAVTLRRFQELMAAMAKIRVASSSSS